MLNLSEGICSELFFFLLIFESQYGDTGLEITEVTEQLLKVYENLTERYRASLHRLEEGSKDNSFQQIAVIFDLASYATFLFLPHFDVICDLLLNKRKTTWNLFVKYTHARAYIR